MAESKTAAVMPLSRANYATWKVQCKMALVKDGLWGIVSGTETAPAEGVEQIAKFNARRDKALATVVLSIDPNLLYIVGPAGPYRPRGRMKSVVRPVSTKDMGKQVRTQAKTVFTETE